MTEKPSSNLANKIEPIEQAQADMSEGYANGSIGIIVSGLMWLSSAIVAFHFSDKQAVWTLLVGGMLIHPLSLLCYKIIGLSGTHTKGNPLANLAMEGTIWMLMCLPMALGLSLQHNEWFFQAMLLIIGGRYLTFKTIYGNKLYWILGAALGLAAYLLFSLGVQSFSSALTGSLIEITFGTFMFIAFRKR